MAKAFADQGAKLRVTDIAPPRSILDQVTSREVWRSRDKVYAGYASGSSMQSWVTAEDIADTTYFLASKGARLISGQVISVDGHTVNSDPKV